MGVKGVSTRGGYSGSMVELGEFIAERDWWGMMKYKLLFVSSASDLHLLMFVIFHLVCSLDDGLLSFWG